MNFWKDLPVDHKIDGMFGKKIEMNKPVRQSVNVFSGIIYLIVAIIILKASQKEMKIRGTEKQNKENLIHKMFFAFILLYVFFASTFYHASLTNLALKINFSAVYFFSLFPVMHLSYRWFLTKNQKRSGFSRRGIIVAVYLVYVAVSLLLSFFIPNGKEHIVTFICILIIFVFAVATILANPEKTIFNHLILCIFFTSIALVWFELGESMVSHSPKSYFRLHSFWNLFIGLSGFYFYVFMRNEDNPKKYLT